VNSAVYDVPSVPSIIYDNTVFVAVPYVVCFAAESQPGYIVAVDVAWTASYVPNQVELTFMRSDKVNQRIVSVTLSVVLYDTTKINQQSPFSTSNVYISSLSGAVSLLSSLPIDFGIAPYFKNEVLGGFEEYCVIGIIVLRIGGIIASAETRYMMFDPTAASINVIGE
jgi:hypothetical protein